MKILFGAYRDWAIEAICRATKLQDHEFLIERTPEDFNTAAQHESWDAIIIVGWSWKVPPAVVNSKLVVGMHPSNLPMFAGGSPIQNQILAGLTESKATLFKLNEKFDEGEIVDKEPISLIGHLDEVLDSIGSATSKLIDRFVSTFPNHVLTKQAGKGSHVRRLKPEHSKLPLPAELGPTILEGDGIVFFETETVKRIVTCKEMWDIIRCHEDPYPNAYFEDETGKLTIVRAEFESK